MGTEGLPLTKRVEKPFGLIALLLVLAACTAAPVATPAPTSTPTPTPTASPTPTPTASPTPTPTVTPTPEPPLSEEGPWQVFVAMPPIIGDEVENQYLWAVNPDGTGLTRLTTDYVWQFQIQPAADGSQGRLVAAITSSVWNDVEIQLTVLRLPGGEVEAVIPLTNPDTMLIHREVPDYSEEEGSEWQDNERRMAAMAAIAEVRSLAWSPDGKQLAFAGAQDGTQVDVYLLELDGSERVTRLTAQEHAQNASNLSWSPDGRTIVYEDIGVSSYLGNPFIYSSRGIWMTRADGSGTRQLVREDKSNADVYLHRQTWVSEHTIAVESVRIDRDEYPVFATFSFLRTIDVESGEQTTVTQGNYLAAFFVPGSSDTWLIVVNSQFDPVTTETITPPATYLVRDGQWELILDEALWPVTWWPAGELFITAQGAFNPLDGTWASLFDLPAERMGFSPDGQYWAFAGNGSGWPDDLLISAGALISADRTSPDGWQWSYAAGGPGFWVGEAYQMPQKKTDLPVSNIQWSLDSQSVLLWNCEDGELYIANTPEFEPHLLITFMWCGGGQGPWLGGGW